MHSDLTRPVPKTEFLSDRIRVAHPSGEPLVCMNDRFSCSSYYNSWPEIGGRPLPGSSPVIRCRKTVFEMLEKAESLLPEGLRFLVLDAFRSVDVQQALWDHYREIFAAEHPDASPEELDRITLKSDILRKYFPRSYTPLQMQQTIIKLLEQWQKKRQRQNER